MSYVWLSNMVKINAYWQVFFLWETRWGYPAPVEKQQSGQIIDLPAEHSTRGAYLGQTKWELCRYYSYYSYYNITTSALGSIFIDFVDFFLLRKQCLCLWFRLIYIYIRQLGSSWGKKWLFFSEFYETFRNHWDKSDLKVKVLVSSWLSPPTM
jgi:hypothetical protein